MRPLVLSEAESAELARIVRRRRSAQALALRARIVLASAQGQTNHAVARQVGVTPATVSKWRGRFVAARLDGLSDEPRPGRPRTLGDADVERVITMTLESTPRGATHWSTRSMAQVTGLNQTAISRIWRAFGLQPHRSETFKLSQDPYFIDKVRDIVGLYMSPPERAVVLCVAEKSQIQALDRTQPVLPWHPRTPDPRLPAPRHDVAVRGPQYRHRGRHRPLLPAPSQRRVSSVSKRHRGQSADRDRRASDPG